MLFFWTQNTPGATEEAAASIADNTRAANREHRWIREIKKKTLGLCGSDVRIDINRARKSVSECQVSEVLPRKETSGLFQWLSF